MMKKQEVYFEVKTEQGVVKEVSKSYVYVPTNQFAGGSIRWYEDRLKTRKAV